MDAALRSELLVRIMATLPARDRQVLELRFGLAGQAAQTLEHVGRRFNLTRERIRQIETRSLAALSSLEAAQSLRVASVAEAGAVVAAAADASGPETTGRSA